MTEVTFTTISFDGQTVVMLDQTCLPHQEVYQTLSTSAEVAEAIRSMVIRGAPAIGIAAAYGIALAAVRYGGMDPATLQREVIMACDAMAETRPTAVNLFWAINRMKRCLRSNAGREVSAIRSALVEESKAIHEEDIRICRELGRQGAALLDDSVCVLTHCNTGALATGGIGTALAVIRSAVEQGKEVRVYADETRPFLQGSRLTSWELLADGIDVTLIADSAAGALIRKGRVDAVIVGTDRTVANGDVANKVGTYSLAVLARENGVPFYVAAPTSTLDLETATGGDIVIEERSSTEITHLFGTKVAPDGVKVYNPGFDVTPAKYVTGIITECGVAYPPYNESLRRLIDRSQGGDSAD